MKPRARVADLLARKQMLDAHMREQTDRSSRLRELRAWQAERLARTYSDLHDDPDYTGAVEFFLCDVYGPRDFEDRDRNLSRAWHYLKRALPEAALDVLARAIELQVLTMELDLKVAEALPKGAITEQTYASTYHAVGEPETRARQIDLIVAIGQDLSRMVRHRWIPIALRAAHTPAHAAGFGTLQSFLERGFAAFRKMPDPQRLMHAVRDRETRLMDSLLNGRNLDARKPSAGRATR